MTGGDRPEPRWLTGGMGRAVHADQVRRHGGALGVRDADLLRSTLARPRNRWHYESDSDLATLAAAYGFGLVRNHPFVDGNKRVGFQAMYIFLRLNGRSVAAEEPEVVDVVLQLAAGRMEEDDLAEWVRGHSGTQ